MSKSTILWCAFNGPDVLLGSFRLTRSEAWDWVLSLHGYPPPAPPDQRKHEKDRLRRRGIRVLRAKIIPEDA